MADNCTEPSALCHVEDTVLGYYPNLGSGVFFTIAFGICLVAALSIGVWKRTWTYTAAIGVGLFLETAGYIGRILLHKNPFNENAFELQICAIILAPTFICVSIYLTLKHIALHIAPETSRFAPKWYPRIFLPADLSCLIVQAIGGGIAAAAGHDKPKLQKDGNRAIIAGVVLQVMVLFMFGILGTDYFIRVRRRFRANEGILPEQRALYNDKKFRMFVSAITGAYMAVLIRCIYRIAEMAGGWGNYIMQDEPSFLVLDSSLIFVTVYLLTIFHPGFFFPQMCKGSKASTPVADLEVADNRPASDSPDSSNEGQKTEKEQ